MTDELKPTTITIYGAQSVITGPFPREAFLACTSYEVEGAKFSPAYKRKSWDGRKNLAKIRTGSFPTGLLDIVKEMLVNSGIEVIVKDLRVQPGRMDLFGPPSFELAGGFTLRPYQLRAAKACVDNGGGIIKAATGCHRKGQKILRSDGRLVNVEEIRIGDRLAGTNGPVNVLSLARGKDTMYEINPVKGEAFVVNSEHVLTLVRTSRKHSDPRDGELIDVVVKDYVEWSAWHKHLHKLVRSGVVEFETNTPTFDIHPYEMGLLLGDGSMSGTPGVTSMDPEIVNTLKDMASRSSLRLTQLTKPDNLASTYLLAGTKGKANPVANILREYGLWNIDCAAKFIPLNYKTASVVDRLDLLAGLLDTDGHLSGTFDFISKSQKLSEDVAFIARSLCLAAYVSSCTKSDQSGTEGIYYRVSISGDLDLIPTRLPRKKASVRLQKKDVLRTGFSVRKLEGEEEYYGFQVDADSRYLMGDFTVTHNSGKSLMLAGVIAAMNLPTLVIVPSRELLHQLRATFLAAIPNSTEKTIGIVGDDEWEVGTCVTVATMSTLYARMDTDECARLLKSVDLLCVDEVHMAGADTWFDVTQACNAYYRVACSGTPYDRTDGGTLRLIASFGDMVANIGYKELVEAKVLPRAKIIFDKITTPVLPKKPKLTYAQAYAQGVVENEEVTKHIVEWTKICVEQGLSVMILVDQISHGKTIDDALWNTEGTMISHSFIHGTSSNRDEALKEFADRELPVLIASSILDTGISIDSLDVLICAGSRKSKIKTLQRLGRALRGEKAIVIEFFSFVHKFLLDHSQQRFKDYKAEDCFCLKQSKPSAELIKRLWEEP